MDTPPRPAKLAVSPVLPDVRRDLYAARVPQPTRRELHSDARLVVQAGRGAPIERDLAPRQEVQCLLRQRQVRGCCPLLPRRAIHSPLDGLRPPRLQEGQDIVSRGPQAAPHVARRRLQVVVPVEAAPGAPGNRQLHPQPLRCAVSPAPPRVPGCLWCLPLPA